MIIHKSNGQIMGKYECIHWNRHHLAQPLMGI